MTEHFKTLVWKKQDELYQCKYAYLMYVGEENKPEFAESSIPHLLPMTSTMKELQGLYPELDLSEVKMIIVKLDNISFEV